ncbi:sulfotransferase [Nocardioides sp. GY 10113]|uniref:sulfotransferase family protein n=1 Tax=Nocardioides sp. GY 10113 TaxID=2569761 RepID=UPI00145818AF|nr:sulfotransferase [Nocardioides sp. GY 10113]
MSDPGQRLDFFVAGGQKCGTTALDAMLRRHPGIEMPTRKELHFFDQESRDWSAEDYAELHAQFDWTRPAVRGESTPIYTYWPGALERIRAYNPGARMVMALRHPVYRAFSQWRMESARGRETLPFAQAIREGRARAAEQPRIYRRRFSHVERGFYAGQARALLEGFGPDQVHFVRTDQLWSRSDEVVEALLDFLGVEQRRLTDGQEYVVPRVQSVALDPLDPEDRDYLREVFADDIRETATLTGVDLSDWLEPDYRDPMTGGS